MNKHHAIPNNITLDNLRDQINQIDDKLLLLLNNRSELAQRIGYLKQQAGDQAIHQPDRETAIIARLKQNNTGPLNNLMIEQLFNQIFTLSRTLQRSMQKNKI